jgi:predicted dehydrogenase
MPTHLTPSITRRGFLRTAGAGLAFGSLARRADAQVRVPDPPGPKLGYALVGLGSLAINQLMPAFAAAERSKLVAFVSGHRDKAEKLAARYGVQTKNIYNYENFDTIRDNPEVDVVYVVLPNGMHAEYTVRAFQAGKHVLCEKPMANSVAECEQMIAAGTKADRKLMVAYRLHYEPYNHALIKVVRDQEFGRVRVVLADAGFPIGDPNQWRLNKKMAGGGSMMDIGIYALNAARYLTGEEPVEVSAMEDTTKDDPRFREVEENILFQLRFPSGVLANCSSSYGVPLNRFRVVGTGGWAELEPALSYNGLKMRAGTWTRIEERIHPVVDQFATEMDNFSGCIQTNQTSPTPGEEGLKDMRLITAIYQSAANHAPVKV